MRKFQIGLVLAIWFLVLIPKPVSAYPCSDGTNNCCSTGSDRVGDVRIYCDPNAPGFSLRKLCQTDLNYSAPQQFPDSSCGQPNTNPTSTNNSTPPSNPFQGVIGTISPPPQVINLTNQGGAAGISTLLTNLITIIYELAAIAVVFMLLFGAFQWIISGGEKEAIAKARSRITWAIIGIVFLALTFVILTVIGRITNINFFQGQSLIPLQQFEQSEKAKEQLRGGN